MGKASRTERAVAGVVVVVTTTAVVAMNPEVVEVAVEVEAAWTKVTVVALITLVALRTKDHGISRNKIIQSTTPFSYKAWERMLQLSLWPITLSRLVLLRYLWNSGCFLSVLQTWMVDSLIY